MAKPKVPYWYLTDGALGFIGIVQSSEDPGDYSTSACGPFKTLTECKKDAIKRFQCDISTCRQAITEIKAARPSQKD